MKRIDLLAIISVVVIFAGGFLLGINWPSSPSHAFVPMNQHQAIEFVESCIASHQQYIDHPEWCDNKTGSVDFNQRVNENYKGLLEYLKILWKEGKIYGR